MLPLDKSQQTLSVLVMRSLGSLEKQRNVDAMVWTRWVALNETLAWKQRKDSTARYDPPTKKAKAYPHAPVVK